MITADKTNSDNIRNWSEQMRFQLNMAVCQKKLKIPKVIFSIDYSLTRLKETRLMALIMLKRNFNRHKLFNNSKMKNKLEEKWTYLSKILIIIRRITLILSIARGKFLQLTNNFFIRLLKINSWVKIQKMIFSILTLMTTSFSLGMLTTVRDPNYFLNWKEN